MNTYTEPIRLIEVQFDDLHADRDKLPTLKTIQDRDPIDGIVVKNVLSQDEIDMLKSTIEGSSEIDYANLTDSITYPASFAEIDPNGNDLQGQLLRYFQKCTAFSESFSDKYGVDLIGRLVSVLGQLNENKGCSVPRSGPQGTSPVPFSFRIMLPEKCHIDLHCGNQFIDRFDYFYQYLTDWVTVVDQLSFFMLLKKPDIGGHLKIFNITYADAQEFNLSEQTVTDPQGRSYHMHDPEEVFCSEVEMEEGDLIIFSAGKLWHKVSEIYGSSNRITMGGFVGFSKSDGEAIIWS